GQSQPFTIAIASTFSAQPIEDSLRFWIGKLAFDAEIVFAPFNQVFQQLLDPGSLFLRNRNGVNVILLRIEDWRARESALSGPQSLGDIESTVEANASYLDQALKSFAARSSVPCVVCLCPASPSMLASEADARRISRIEESLKDGLEGAPDVHIITSRDLSSKYPVAEYYDRRGYELGAIPYTSHFFTALGTMIARTLSALRGPSYKVIALDCDHTLWNGICGEDGAEAVTIEPAHRFLQEFMVAQHDAGMLLCLCSKNNEADVVEVFERNPEMIVRLDHIVSRRINWAPKADNLKAMADELHLGLDSFIFIDDDPVECAAMRATTPEVLTLQLPERRDLIPRFLNNVWAFDRVRLTEEDRQRTGLYRRARRREQSEREAPSIEQFLAGLDLRVEIAKLEPADIDRVSQLTYRTNQFNLTSRRRTARDIQLLHGSGSLECYVVRMSDRFGEYGLVGVMIFHAAGESLNVDTFLLSCRALGKNAEKRMVEWLGEYAARRGLGEVVLPFVHGPRNQPALEFLEGIGRPFKQVAGEGLVFRLPARYAAGLENQSAVLSTSGVSI
ncbi:MAG TPA: HAD-IIIC family phosphatase, partial [Blastocatellia bacterium]|nr:HAD-IIIC family phosphatase [Blastocatellia bacterium]